MSYGLKKRACFIPLFLSVFFVCGNNAWSQIKLNAKLAMDRFLTYEPITLRVYVENNSGNDLVFDYDSSNEAHLTVAVKREDQPVYQKRVINNADTVFRLASGQRRELTVVLNGPGMFQLHKEGNYTYYVQIGHPRFTADFRTVPAKIEIADGQTLWTEAVGIPADGPDDTIKTRDVSVLWFRGKTRDHYALMIEDKDHVYAVERLGERVSNEKPVCRVDARSNIHILQRLSARVYGYKIYDYKGRMLQLKIVAVDDKEGPPGLVRDKELGVVRQVGGREAVRGEDYELYDGQVRDAR
ncbi:MAG: hypothetical protein RRC34_04715 [Lentisphaeria bacterium]|nr:hypothetical protein [Lentisphaeria bacterium]